MPGLHVLYVSHQKLYKNIFVKSELIIDSQSSGVTIALLDDGRLMELHKDSLDSSISVGDIYLGKVKKINSSLNASFIDVGYEKDGFLHYHDLSPQYKSFSNFVKQTISGKLKSPKIGDKFLEEIPKDGKVENVLKTQQNLLVQVSKEPISTKGPRLNVEISLAGRFLILLPFSNKISVSQKIQSFNEKKRLKRLVDSIRPKGFGVIIRTVAKDKKVADLHLDLNNLLRKWNACHAKLQKAKAPTKIMGEQNRVNTLLRDILNDSFNSIIVNDKELAQEIKDFIMGIAPEKKDLVKVYGGKKEIFENFNITKQIKSSFGKHVSLTKGAYLVIEHTEAMHVVDVNSGSRSKIEETQELTSLEVNLNSAKEIARQLRLRDMGGIIVVDFIDMRSSQNRKKILECMLEEMKKDRAKHKILPLSRFGVMEITRQRVRPAIKIKTQEMCPSCSGTGEVKSSLLLMDEIEEKLDYLINEKTERDITICTHPFVYSHITKGLSSIRVNWFSRFKKWVKIRSMSSYAFLEYRFFDSNDDELTF